MTQLEKASSEQPETTHQGCGRDEADATQKDGMWEADSHKALGALHSFPNGLPVWVAQTQLPGANLVSLQGSRVESWVPRGYELHWHGLSSPHNKAVGKVRCDNELMINERDVCDRCWWKAADHGG